MPFFVKSCVEDDNYIRLATREKTVNSLRVIAVIFAFLAVPCLMTPLAIMGVFFLAVTGVCALIAQYLLTVTVIDKKEMTIKQKNKVTPLSEIDCILTWGHVRKYKTKHSTQYVPYFLLSVMRKSTSYSKTFIEMGKEYVEAISKQQEGLISKEQFEQIEQEFFNEYETRAGESIDIIDTPNEHKAWQISEKIAKLLNIPVVDMVGGLLIRESKQLDMPYAEFLQQDFISTFTIDHEDCDVTHRIEDGKLTITLGKSQIEVDKDNISVNLQKKWFSYLKFKGNHNPIALKSIESMRHIVETTQPYISLVGDNDYSQICFDKPINCFVIYLRIRHFLATELKKIEVPTNGRHNLEISCDVLFRGISSNVMKFQSVEEIRKAIIEFLNKHDKSIKELEDDAFNEIESRLLKAGYINAEKDDKGVARWSITELGSSIVLP